MALSYTIRAVAGNQIIVDYANDTWAVVPIENGMSRESIEDRIRQFAGLRTSYPSTATVPFKPGDTGEVLSNEELRERDSQEQATRKYTYAQIRQMYYPTVGDQMDAVYWSRNGKTEDLDALDATITQIKQAIPKDSAPMTLAEAAQLTTGLQPIVEGMSTEALIAALES